MQKNQRSRDFTVTQQFSDSFLRNQRAGVPRFRTAPLEPVREDHLASRRVAQKVAVVASSRVLRSSPHDEPATFIAWGGPQVHEYFRAELRGSSGGPDSAPVPSGTPRQFRRSRLCAGCGAELRVGPGSKTPAVPKSTRLLLVHREPQPHSVSPKRTATYVKREGTGKRRRVLRAPSPNPTLRQRRSSLARAAV